MSIKNDIDGTGAFKATRRGLLKLGSIAGGGLALGFYLPASAKSTPSNAAQNAAQLINAFVQIRSDNQVIIGAQNPEIGQGVKTSMPMIVAEELDADWQTVKVVQTAIDKSLFGRQVAGGSRSIASRWEALRNAGASARAQLVAAAADRWQVAAAECRTESGRVIHASSGRALSYGQLAEEAAQKPLVENVSFKKVSDFSLLGQRIGGVDNKDIVTGEPLFGIDQRVEGMRYAVYAKCPAAGGIVKSANLADVKKLPGVIDAFVLKGNGKPEELMSGVAIVANSTWAAFSARKHLKIEWDESKACQDSWQVFQEQARDIALYGATAVKKAKASSKALYTAGEVDQALSDSTKELESYYSYSFVSHAQLEPQNCTASYSNGKCELWAPTQAPQGAVGSVAKILSLQESDITLHQTRIGGGFGRRLLNDYCCEAAAISQHAGVPIKLQWSREDDMAHDFYRVGGFHSLRGGIDAQGQLSAWHNHFISFTSDGERASRGGHMFANEFPVTKLDNAGIQQTLLPLDLPAGWWRAPGACSIAFATQSFIHELAVEAGIDHRDFLLGLIEAEDIGSEKSPFDSQRAATVIRQVCKNAHWGESRNDGRTQGLAFYYSHAGYFAHVAEISVSDAKQVRLHKMSVVGDVGPIVNLSGAENQVEGSVVDGFSTMMGLAVSFEEGRVQQQNYHHYPLLRMNKAPTVDIQFIQSDNPPTGLGEPALPPVAPAVGNALFTATGQRVREMPFSLSGFTV